MKSSFKSDFFTAVIIFFFTAAGLSSQEGTETQWLNIEKESKDEPEFYDYSGASYTEVNHSRFRPHFPGNTIHMKSQTLTGFRYDPDFLFGRNTIISGQVKPRVTVGFKGISHEREKTNYESELNIKLYEAYLSGKFSELPGKGRIGIIDLSGGYGQLFNPGNLWQTRNNTDNPTAVRKSEPAVFISSYVNNYLSIDFIADSNTDLPDFQLIPAKTSDQSVSQGQQDLDARVRNSFNEKYNIGNYYGPKSRYYDYKRYDKTDRAGIKKGSESPLYAGTRINLNYGKAELTLSAKGASHMPSSFGSSVGITVTDGLLIYGEGSYTTGRTHPVPVRTGEGDSVIRLRNYSLHDPYNPNTPYIDRTDSQYEYLYDNFSPVRRAIGGIKYTFPGIPVTASIEYAYDGNGYSEEELIAYYRGLSWAGGPGLNTIRGEEDIKFDAILIQDLIQSGKINTTEMKYRDLFQKDAALAADFLEKSADDTVLPERMGKHYSNFQIMWNSSDGKDVLIYRFLLNTGDNSSRNSVYFSKALTGSWSIAGTYIYDYGRTWTEYKKSHVQTFTVSGIYFW